MEGIGVNWRVLRGISVIFCSFLLASIFVSAERSFKHGASLADESDSNYFVKLGKFLWQKDQPEYQPVWPEMKFGWKIVLGTIFGFIGGAFGSVGGVGGGGIFVPMLKLIIGFDSKSAAAMSKCMIMGAAVSTVFYNLQERHPTLDMPIVDYDLALLIQPMLLLGISIGVTFNVVFADWMVTVLLIILFLVTSTKAFFKGVEAWKKETIMKKDAARGSEVDGNASEDAEYKLLPGGPSNGSEREKKRDSESKVSILDNIRWLEFGLLFFVWAAFLALQIIKSHAATCSTLYWVVNLLQIPVSVGVSSYEGICLYKGWKKIASKGNDGTSFKVYQLISYGFFGLVAGVVGGLLGVGGGSVMGPLFLELGIPAQVSSATATFAMMFSSSMSAVEYYLLKRFPVPYTLYYIGIATIAAFIGQYGVQKLIILLGRTSLIIFILAFMIFVSALSLGGVGISNMIGMIQRHDYMGFDDLCKYDV